MKKEAVSLNRLLKVEKKEVAIDFFTSWGEYRGSITVEKRDADRIVFAINTCNNLLISGKTGMVSVHCVKRKQ